MDFLSVNLRELKHKNEDLCRENARLKYRVAIIEKINYSLIQIRDYYEQIIATFDEETRRKFINSSIDASIKKLKQEYIKFKCILDSGTDEENDQQANCGPSIGLNEIDLKFIKRENNGLNEGDPIFINPILFNTNNNNINNNQNQNQNNSRSCLSLNSVNERNNQETRLTPTAFMTNQIDVETNNNNLFKCIHCGETFSNQNYLDVHKRIHVSQNATNKCVERLAIAYSHCNQRGGGDNNLNSRTENNNNSNSTPQQESSSSSFSTSDSVASIHYSPSRSDPMAKMNMSESRPHPDEPLIDCSEICSVNMCEELSDSEDSVMNVPQDEHQEGDAHDASAILNYTEYHLNAKGLNGGKTRRNRSYTIEEKLFWIEEYHKCKNKMKVANMGNIKRQLLQKWIKDENKLRELVKNNTNYNRLRCKRSLLDAEERQKCAKWHKMETELYKWILKQKIFVDGTEQWLITRDDINHQAQILFSQHETLAEGESFKCSNGWYHGFKKRYGLHKILNTNFANKIRSEANKMMNTNTS